MSLDEGISVPEAVDRGSLALAFGVDVAVGKVSAHKALEIRIGTISYIIS